jgi:hypothetical protein
MYCTMSTTCSRPISSSCCTEHGQRYGAVLLGHITTVAISISDQLGRRCTVELHYSGLHVLQASR